MSSPTTSQESSISQHLRVTKEILQDVASRVRAATTPDNAKFDVLEQDAFEILHLIRFWRNTVAPINQIPPEILALIPDFWDPHKRDQDVIALTHVCRAWREAFLSRSSLWTNLECFGGVKTLVYFKRSGSSPINLSLIRYRGMSRNDPFFEIIPHAIGRLVSLFLEGGPEELQNITAHLCRPAPLLKGFTIRGIIKRHNHVLSPALFGGDLSSLRTLCLLFVRTGLPWRNMVNLTSFTLGRMPPGGISVRQLLDFFESAPHLRDIDLHFATPTPGAQDGRLVTLTCLEEVEITDCGPSSALLDHLLIPVGAILTTKADFIDSLIGNLLPRSLDNLRNFSNFTKIQLSVGGSNPYMEFSGPNGRVSMTLTNTSFDKTRLLLESLAQLDTSETERLVIEEGEPRSIGDPFHQALPPMTDLRSLTLSRCASPHIFIQALQPDVSSSEVVVCPKLEELIVVLWAGETFDTKSVINMAAVRASRGKELRTVRIVDRWGKLDQKVILELKKHIFHVEHVPVLV